MKEESKTLLCSVQDLHARLPSYACLISLYYAKLQLQAVQVEGATFSPEVLNTLYRKSISDVLQKEFGLPEEIASSDDEFLDFYIRHGILANKLASLIFQVFSAQMLPGADPEECEKLLQATIDTINSESAVKA